MSQLNNDSRTLSKQERDEKRVTETIVKESRGILVDRDNILTLKQKERLRSGCRIDRQGLQDIKRAVLQDGFLNSTRITGQIKDFLDSLGITSYRVFFESVLHLFVDFSISSNKSQIVSAIVHFIRHIIPDASEKVICYAETVFSSVRMQDDLFEEQEKMFGEQFFSDLSDLLKKRASVVATATWKAIQHVMGVVLAYYLDMSQGTNDSKIIEMVSTLFKPISLSGEVLIQLLESLVLIIHQGYCWLRTGQFTSFIYKKDSVTKWQERFDQALLDKANLNSPDVSLRKQPKELLQELTKLCNDGKSIMLYLSPTQKKLFMPGFKQCMNLQNDIHNVIVGTKFRKAPFSILVYGEPNVGKTTFVDKVCDFFAACRGFECNADSKYTRNSIDPFFSGCTTAHNIYVLDDLAFESPNMMTSISESSIRDVIQIINNNVLLLNMADLSEKGKVYCNPDLVVGTTNKLDLNANSMFETPYAALRRFPYVVDLSVREEFKDDVTGGLNMDTEGSAWNEAKIELGEDVWNIRVLQVLPKYNSNNRLEKAVIYKELFETTSVAEFRLWFKEMSDKHEQKQTQIMQSYDRQRGMSYCMMCGHEKPNCTCTATTQDGRFWSPAEIYWTRIYYYVILAYRILMWQLNSWSAFTCGVALGKVFVCAFTNWLSWYYLLPAFLIEFWYFEYLRIDFFLWMLYQVYLRLPCQLQRFIVNTYVEWWAPDWVKKTWNSWKLVQCFTILMASLSTYVLYRQVKDYSPSGGMRDVIRERELYDMAQEDKPAPAIQGGAMSSGPKDVYYQDVEKSVAFDFGSQITSWKALDKQQVLDKIKSNVVRLDCFDVTVGDKPKKTGVGIFVKGQYLLTNAHLFYSGHCFVVHHKRMNVALKQRVSDVDIHVNLEKDLMVIRFRNVPPFADITGLFPKNHIKDMACDVSIVTPTRNEIIYHESKLCKWLGDSAIKHPIFQTPLNPDGTASFEKYCAMGIETTEGGDCGSPYVAFTPLGPSIVAIHQAKHDGSPTFVSGVALRLNDIESLVPTDELVVQGGTILRDTCQFTLMDWSKDSNLRRIPDAHFYLFGTSQRRFPSKSNVHKSILFEDCVKAGFQDLYGAPVMRSREVWINQALPMVSRDCVEDHGLVDQAVQMFKDEVLETIPIEEFISEIRVLSGSESLNGIDGMKYVDKIPRKTSAGFPFNCSKMNFLDFSEIPVKVTSEIEEDFRRIEDIAKSGQRVMPIFMASLKDEPIKKKKILSKKTRIFTGSPFSFSLLMRKYLLTLNAFIQKRRRQFECCAGVNALGPEWGEICEYMSSFSQDFVAGDYEAYDKKMMASLILAAGNVLLNMCGKAGFSSSDLMVVQVLIYDLAFPVVNFDGDIIMTCGSEPSGHPLTVIINSLVGSILMRMAFISICPGKSFKEHVRLIVYGDDNMFSTTLKQFNHTAVAQFLETQGFRYTMADKEAKSVPFITIDEATFLKRSFRFHEDLKRIVGPLDRTSMCKMLMYHIPSGAISPENHAVQVLNTYCREMFFYGKEEYEQALVWCKSLITKHDLGQCVSQSYFLPYVSLCEYYEEGVREHEDPTNAFRTFVQCGAFESDCPLCGYADCDTEVTPVRVCKRCNHCRSLNNDENDAWFLGCEYCETTFPMRCDLCGDVEVGYQYINQKRTYALFFCYECMYLFSPRDGFTVPIQQIGTSRRRDPMHSVEHVSGMQRLFSGSQHQTSLAGEDAKCCIKTSQNTQTRSTSGASNPIAEGRCDREEWYSPQPQVQDDSEEKVQETVEFHDIVAPEKVILDSTEEELSMEMAETSASLADFFSRPVNVWSKTWTESEGTGYNAYFFPWYEYFLTDTVKYKLNNWAFIRCNLHVRFVYNASPFYYGAMMASYKPLINFNNVFLQNGSSRELIPLSQVKGRVMIYPQCPEDQEIVLPFFHPQNFVRCQVASEVQNLGSMTISIVDALKSANGVTGAGITVKAYAWATDVVLSGPSIGLSVQDAEIQDEYGVGPVSKPASAIANVAARLGDVPVIGKFATATQIGASAVSNIAKLFGFTNVPVIEDQKGFHPRALPPMASTDIGFPFEKLTVDPKNELTIDHRSVGLGPLDELPISHLAQKESYITSMSWTTSNADNDLLFTSAVTPQIFDRSGTANPYLYMTPMCWLATMFNYWHGDIIFRFKIVCSKYHRGRLRITFDPDGYTGKNVTTDTLTSNVAMTKIVDIAEETDVEFRVPYQQATAWLECTNAANFPAMTMSWGSSGFKHVRGLTNGSLAIRVHNILTAPTSTSTISVLVFVRAAENLEFASPTTIGLDKMTPATVQDGSTTETSDAAVQLYSRPSAPVDHLYLTYMGERVASLRVLLRRMCRIQTIGYSFPGSNDYQIFRAHLARQPIRFGYDVNGWAGAKGVVDTGSNFAFNWVQGNYLGYVAPAFVGNRGSVNWSVVVDAGQSSSVKQLIALRNKAVDHIEVSASGANINASPSINEFFYWSSLNPTGGGSAVVNQMTSGAANFQVPFYSKYKFGPTQMVKVSSTNSGTYVDNDFFTLEVEGSASAGTSLAGMRIATYAGAGTDYDLLYFLHVPTYGYITSTLTPV